MGKTEEIGPAVSENTGRMRCMQRWHRHDMAFDLCLMVSLTFYRPLGRFISVSETQQLTLYRI
jgi:hypothetical protein